MILLLFSLWQGWLIVRTGRAISSNARPSRGQTSKLIKRGLILVGIDIIGNKLTEINVTSPTGFREIKKFSNINLAKKLIDSLT